MASIKGSKTKKPRKPQRRPTIEDIHVAHSPLSNELVIYRTGKDLGLALEKRYATGEIMSALMDYFFHDVEDNIPGIEQSFEINDNHYKVTVFRSQPKKRDVLHVLEEISDFDQTPEEARKELEEDGVDVPSFLDRVAGVEISQGGNMKLFKLVPVKTPESDSPAKTVASICSCSGPNYDLDFPCPVPGHYKLGPHGNGS